MSKRILPHIQALSSEKAQESLPRYRKRNGTDNKYVFACRLKKARHLWLVIDEEFFGIMDADMFGLEYVNSNHCSRDQRGLYAKIDSGSPVDSPKFA
jgi:hypothetical protein